MPTDVEFLTNFFEAEKRMISDKLHRLKQSFSMEKIDLAYFAEEVRKNTYLLNYLEETISKLKDMDYL